MSPSKKNRDPEVDEEVQQDAMEGLNTGAVSPSPPPSPGGGITEDEEEQSRTRPGHPGDEPWSAPESGAVP
jgi:hypothetical protein